MASGKDVTEFLRRKFGDGGKPLTDKALAARLGMGVTQLSSFKTDPTLSALKIANLLLRAESAAVRQAHQGLIRSVVEFFPIDTLRPGKGPSDLFSTRLAGKPHPYRTGLRAQLESSHGVYVFYDSRGRALYTGKAKEQSLWKEMNLAFNRDRGDLQTLNRVDHPERGVAYRPTNEKRRQIVKRAVLLSELASYFSAYAVVDEMVSDLEAFLIRAFPNDLLNKKKEQMGKARAKAKTGRTKPADS